MSIYMRQNKRYSHESGSGSGFDGGMGGGSFGSGMGGGGSGSIVGGGGFGCIGGSQA